VITSSPVVVADCCQIPGPAPFGLGIIPGRKAWFRVHTPARRMMHGPSGVVASLLKIQSMKNHVFKIFHSSFFTFSRFFQAISFTFSRILHERFFTFSRIFVISKYHKHHR